MEDGPEYILRVRGGTPAKDLASAISHGLYDGNKVVMRAVGAGAVNQAVKAFIIAQSLVASRGLILSMRGGFCEIKMPDQTMTTGINLRVISD